MTKLRFQWFKNLSRSFQGFLIGALCAALTLGAAHIGALNVFERDLLDTMFRLRGPLSDPDPDIVLVVVDDSTVAEANSWPLPRHYYADILKRLDRAGAKTVAFDVLFTTPVRDPQEDVALVEASRSLKSVVPAAVFYVPPSQDREAEIAPLTVSITGRPLAARYAVTDRGAETKTAAWVTAALPELNENAPAVGHINVFPEVDGKLRRVPHLIRYRGNLFPSLALASTAAFLGQKPRDIIVDENSIKVGNYHIPIDQNGESLVNWTGGNNSFPTYTFLQVLNGQVDDSVFRNRLVLVGATAWGAYEHRPTPFSPWQPAIELQANAIDNILKDRVLREVPLRFQLAIALLFPLICGVLVAQRSALAGTLVIFGLCIWFVCLMLLLFHYNLYMPAAAPLLASLLSYAAVTAINYRREDEANWMADAAVTTLARGAAVMASGRDRAKLIAVIRRTAREALQAQEVFVALDGQSGDFLVNQVAEHLMNNQQSLLWSGEKRLPSFRRKESAEITEVLLRQLCEHVAAGRLGVRKTPTSAQRTVVAAMLAYRGTPDEEQATETRNRTAHGMLIAVGRRKGDTFSPRDAKFLETLAEQASLALENLAYYERLQGRIELANRDLREAYRLLEEQSAKLTAAVESIDDALIVTDPQGHAIFMNAASNRILAGCQLALGADVPATLNKCDFKLMAALFDKLHSTPAALETASCETIFEDSREARRILASHLTPLMGGDGNPLGAMLVIADVTAQRELEQMKTDFVAYVAHELRTPLTTILGYASLLHDAGEEFPPDQRKQMTQSIMGHCQRLNRMITEMLDIARLDAGRPLTLHVATFDLVALGSAVMHNQEAALRDSQQISLHLESNHLTVMLEADRDRVEQILTNLVSNAVKYSPDGGDVTLAINDAGEAVEIIVRDTGMGMTPDQTAQLFQKFFRSADAQARGIKGTGLGLFLVKQLIEAHQGTVEVTSAPGQGTTFMVRLPKTHLAIKEAPVQASIPTPEQFVTREAMQKTRRTEDQSNRR